MISGSVEAVTRSGVVRAVSSDIARARMASDSAVSDDASVCSRRTRSDSSLQGSRHEQQMTDALGDVDFQLETKASQRFGGKALRRLAELVEPVAVRTGARLC